LTLEDEDNTFPRNFGIRLGIDAASYQRRTEYSATLLPKNQT